MSVTEFEGWFATLPPFMVRSLDGGGGRAEDTLGELAGAGERLLDGGTGGPRGIRQDILPRSFPSAFAGGNK